MAYTKRRIWLADRRRRLLEDSGPADGFDITQASISQGTIIDPSTSDPTAICWGNGGTYVYIFHEDSADYSTHQYECSTPYDITTMGASLGKYLTNWRPRGLWMSADGVYLYTVGTASQVRRLTLSTPYDITSATVDQNVGINVAYASQVRGVHFTDDGLTAFFCDYNVNDYIIGFTLSTAWDVSTIASPAVPDIIGQSLTAYESTLTGFTWSPSGDKLYICGYTNYIHAFSAATAFDPTDLTYLGEINLATEQTGNPQDISQCSTDGTGLHVVWNSTARKVARIGV